MRLSVNTVVLALLSSSVVMTGVLAVPLQNNVASAKSKLTGGLRNKGSRSLATRQDAPGLNLTALAPQFDFLEDAIIGMSAILVAVTNVVSGIAEEIGLDGDNTGDDGQDGGDGSGDDSNGDSGSGDGATSGDSGDDGDGATGGSGDDGTTDNGNSTVTRRMLPVSRSLGRLPTIDCIRSGRTNCL